MATISLAAPASTRLPEVFAWGCVGLALAGMVVTAISSPVAALSGHVYEDTATALIWAVLAGLLLRRTAHPAVPIFVVVASCATLTVVASGYVAAGGAGATSAAWVGGWIWVVSTFVPVTLLPATFPSGRMRERWLLVSASVVGILVMMAGLATARRIETAPRAWVDNPLAVSGSDGLYLAGSALVLVAGVSAVTSLVLRTRRTQGEDRRRFAPVAVASVITLPVLTLSGMAGDLAPVIQLASAPLIPGAVVLSILQYRLYEIEVVVRRSVVFAGLTVLVIGGYVLVVQAVANLLDRPPGTMGSVLAAGVVALVFAPARSGLQHAAGRWVYGERDDPRSALADVTAALTGAAEPSRAVELAAQRLRAALRVPWLRVESIGGSVVEVGVRPGWASDDLVTRIELVHLGVLQGVLSLTPRSPHERLEARDLALIGPLATMIAAVLASGRLVADLQRSREDVVLAREEERRRVRRDLHDGVGPLLSALSTHADVASLRLERAPESVPELLHRIRQIADDAVTGLRRAVEGLQPTSIDELGLVAALRELAAALSSDDVPVEVTGLEGTGLEGTGLEGTGRAGAALPAAVEVAAYRIAAEAVHNALRHGRPGIVRVHLSRVDDLVVEVHDDGTGIDPLAVPGVGLASMRRRAEELGGALTIESDRTGTRVRAVLPIRAAQLEGP